MSANRKTWPALANENQEKARDGATYTVEAVATILLMLADANPDTGNIHLAVNWLGTQLEQAGMVLNGGAA